MSSSRDDFHYPLLFPIPRSRSAFGAFQNGKVGPDACKTGPVVLPRHSDCSHTGGLPPGLCLQALGPSMEGNSRREWPTSYSQKYTTVTCGFLVPIRTQRSDRRSELVYVLTNALVYHCIYIIWFVRWWERYLVLKLDSTCPGMHRLLESEDFRRKLMNPSHSSPAPRVVQKLGIYKDLDLSMIFWTYIIVYIIIYI